MVAHLTLGCSSGVGWLKIRTLTSGDHLIVSINLYICTLVKPPSSFDLHLPPFAIPLRCSDEKVDPAFASGIVDCHFAATDPAPVNG